MWDMYTTLFKAFSDESLAPDHHYLDYLRIPLPVTADILGLVDGLFLIRHQLNRPGPDCTRLALLNPAMIDLKLLSVPDSNSKPHFWPSMQRIGFGFHPLANDFKVVAFWELEDRMWEHPGHLMNTAVYSLANDSWKHMDHYSRTTRNTPAFGDSVTAYLNGACHWLLDDHSILSFDIGSEVFREVKGPHNPRSHSTIASLFLYNNDSLAMSIYTYHGRLLNSIDLMVMPEEGCWTKHLTVDVRPSTSDPDAWCLEEQQAFLETRDKYEFKRIKTHGYHHDGYIKDLSRKLVLYDPTTNETKDLGIQVQDPACRHRQIFSYNESLVSVIKRRAEVAIRGVCRILSKISSVLTKKLQDLWSLLAGVDYA